MRRLHAGHGGVLDFPLVCQPLEEGLQAPKAVIGRRGLLVSKR